MNLHLGLEFDKMPQKEQKFIADNIEMKEGIARNRALLENLFTLFVCVNAKVPLFIVGKPGCSKSLSVQLLYKSMKGEISDNSLFKSLPKLMINSYQGSLGSTSKGVLNIFQKARQLLEKETDENLAKIISMIYFDEMGLAEHSPNNPLKVIHSELEYDLNEGKKKIAFVGISNWRLDASKMNRGLYLSIPQPDLDDLKQTAKTIAESYNIRLAQQNNELFETLAITYYEYKQILINEYKKKEDFHGSRDFYHLIKNAMKLLLERAENEQNKEIDEHVKEVIGINSLERNFGGLEINNESSLEIIKKIFKKKYENCPINKKYDVLKVIKDNINDKGSRYLLLISKSSLSNYLISTILSDETVNKDSSFYIGSRFIKDQHSEEYSLKILNKVQIQMEQNKVLLLTDLEPVYPALYDLFNQNFTVVSDKNYARIAIGSSNNTFSLVNDNFKCIVLVDQNMIDKEEAPFLNRFEKHVISFEYLLTVEMVRVSEEIYELIQDLSKIHLPEKDRFEITYDINKLLVNCDKEEIQGIIFSKYQSQGKKLQLQELQDYVLEKIALTLPQDIILLMKYSGFEQKHMNAADKIINFYEKGEHNNFYNFISTMKNIKNVIYTFSSINEPLLSNISGSFNTNMLGKMNKDSITEVLISSLSAENELENELEKFYLDPNKKIFVLKFNPDETDIMNYIKFFIENYIKEKNYTDENKNIKKAYVFTIHMNRIFKEDLDDPKKKKYIERNELGELISHLSDFYQIFIDNLNGEDLSLSEIMKIKKEEELFRKCLKLDKEFMKSIYESLSYFSLEFTINVPEINEDNYSTQLIKYLKNEKEITKKIIDCVLRQKGNKKDIFREILVNNYFKREDIVIISVVQRYLSESFTDNISQFVFRSEKDHFLSTILYNNLLLSKKININKEMLDDEKEEEMKLYPEDKKIEEYQPNEKEIVIINKNLNDVNKDVQNYKENILIKKTIDYYLETLDTSVIERFIKKMKKNKITLLLGLKIPGIKHILSGLRTYIINGLNKQYFELEKEIRSLDQSEAKEVYNLNNKIENCQKNMETEINKNELFQMLKKCEKENLNDSNQFYNYLLDDYYLIFLSENLIKSLDNLEEYKSLLKKMVNLRFNYEKGIDEGDPIKSLAKKMVWLESYSEYISIILNIYQKISVYEKNIFQKIETIIDNNEIEYEISERSPHFTKEINIPFFYIMESLLKTITKESDIYQNLKDQEFYRYLSILKLIIQNSLRIVNELMILSKEVFTIQEFLNIEENLNNVNKSSKENLLTILKMLATHSKFVNNNINNDLNYEDLVKSIQSINDFLFENIGNNDYYVELILDICVDEAKKIRNEHYRQKLTDIILNNPKIIPKSYKFISIILSGLIDINVEFISDNLINIKNIKKSYLDSICNFNNDSLNEILLNIFENQFNSYFDSIPKLNDDTLRNHFHNYFEYLNTHKVKNLSCTLLDKSLDLFNQCINQLESIFKKEEEKFNNELLCKIYCISYIKMYLFKCIYYNFTNYQDFPKFKKIYEAIEGPGNNKFRKMVKIYVLKIFFYLLNNNYLDFEGFSFHNHGIDFYSEFKELFALNTKKSILNYYLLPIDNEMNKYNEIYELFNRYKGGGFVEAVAKFKDDIERNGIDNFYTISSNTIISNLAMKTYTLNSNEYSEYSSFAKSLFDDKLSISKTTKNLFLLFSNDQEFLEKIKPKFDDNEINGKQLEILLYSLRFCLQTTSHGIQNESLYSQIISEKCDNTIKDNCLPGNNLIDNIKVNGFYEVEKHLNLQPNNVGAYVCSCGTYYAIPPCGFPWREDNGEKVQCLHCGLNIGYDKKPRRMPGYHGMVIREGHYRIFKNQEQKDEQMNMFGDTDKNIPNMLLDDYKTKVIDPILKNSIFGINQITKIRFEQNNLKVRNLSKIGYRLLNFILYSHLFFGHCLGYITDDNMNKYICEGLSCIKMLEIDWDFLDDSLQSKGIKVIQIFMNMIFYKIINRLITYKEIKNLEDLEKCEDEIEKLLEESYKEYEDYSKKYDKYNEQYLQLNKDSMKALLLENNEISHYEDTYPFYRLFLMTTYPTKEHFINELKKIPQFDKKYPLLNIYLVNNNEEKELIKYIPDMNEFVNFMIDNYSYKITREEASEKLIKDEEIYKENIRGFKEMFNKFINIWKKLKPYATKYGCRDEMPQIDLDENQKLAYFLNDNGELGKGMYIAAAYQKLIDWQNAFLQGLIESLKQNGILHHLVKNMDKTIEVQRAKKNEVLNFDKVNESLMEIIFDNSKRNIFLKDDTINYKNYKQFIYDFENIERSLGEMLLPGKVKFSDNLRFVTYSFEGFRGSKSSVITDFEEKYKSIPLNKKNKQIIFDLIKDKRNNQNNALTKILFSIQLLIYHLSQEKKEENDEIKIIIKDLPEYVILCNECKEFFDNENLQLRVKELIGVFSYIELLCFKPIVENLRTEYKKAIDADIQDNIKKLFEGAKLKIINKIGLASACRKLISRYLVSMRDDTDISEKNPLTLYLAKKEFWNKQLWNEENSLSDDIEILSKYELTVGQCYQLYELLGGDEDKIFEGINIKNEEEKEEDNNEEENKPKIIKKKNKVIW